MTRPSHSDLAAVLAANPGLRVNRGERKYRNIPTVIDDFKFDSKKEAKRFQELQILERAGEIQDLTLQPKYEFRHNGIKIGSYKPDFQYREHGLLVVEDVKGGTATKTTAYRLRKKLMLAFFGIEVREV